MNMEIVQVTKAHLPQIAALEKQCFAEPWSLQALELYLGKQAVAFAATAGETLLGYVGLFLAPGEGQITNLAVFPEYRRQGVAKALLTRLLREAGQRNLSSLSLEVRASNTPAVRLYQSFGFAVAGTRKSFYRHPAEDALVMTLLQKGC